MSEKQDVGLEEVEDFVDSETETEQAEKGSVESKLETLQSFDLKNVSHVIIGPKSISLVPTGMVAKFSKTDDDNSIGLGGSKIMEYDLDKIVGAIERVSILEKELANTKAELERVKSQHADPKEEEPEDKPEDEDEPEEEEKAEPEGDDQKAKEEEAKKEKEEAEVKQPEGSKKEADHSAEPGMDDLMRGLKAAKEKKIL